MARSDARSGAVVAGLVCLDIIPAIPHADLSALQPGQVMEIGAPVMATGGAVANTGLGLHRLGIPAHLIGKVGDDPLGRIVVEQIRSHDDALAAHMITAPDEITSYTIVLSPQNSDRAFMHCPGANHSFGADDVDYDLLHTAQLFHFGYPPYMERIYANDGAELVTMMQRASATGAITSLDMALPDPNGPSGQIDWRQIMARTLPHVDLFLPSLDEIRFMLGYPAGPPGGDPQLDADISAIATELLTLGASVVVLKLGTRGLYLRTGSAELPFLAADWVGRELWVPCFQAQPFVGTTGSGDTTIAGFLAALLRDQSPEAALTSAVAVGACNVEAADALGGLRSWPETQARIAAGWDREPLTVHAPGWQWDATAAIWHGPHDRAP